MRLKQRIEMSPALQWMEYGHERKLTRGRRKKVKEGKLLVAAKSKGNSRIEINPCP